MTLQSMPLVAAVHRALLDRGAWPLIRLTPAELAADFSLTGMPRDPYLLGSDCRHQPPVPPNRTATVQFCTVIVISRASL
jgi:hypothetical protein